ncbi:hypothetical protein CGRA01v4_04904 [Colletotrichum graminicola]|nr:hypothetical protein CGRA01v4_04904 [Colletotrichum graminicola]
MLLLLPDSPSIVTSEDLHGVSVVPFNTMACQPLAPCLDGRSSAIAFATPCRPSHLVTSPGVPSYQPTPGHVFPPLAEESMCMLLSGVSSSLSSVLFDVTNPSGS